MTYEKKIKTRVDNGNGLVIRIPKAMVDIMSLLPKQTLTISLLDDKSFTVKVQDNDNAGN